ncbi:hypothetical protein YC2023_012407 [Brassica napus]
MHLTGQAIEIANKPLLQKEEYLLKCNRDSKKDIRSNGNAASEYLIGSDGSPWSFKKKITMDHDMIYVRPRIVLIGSELEK